jgi:hypothetical protein
MKTYLSGIPYSIFDSGCLDIWMSDNVHCSVWFYGAAHHNICSKKAGCGIRVRCSAP